ncbi:MULTISPECIES: stage II sporulation protein E [Alicyclobacillus]|uniref:Stage II sporulation protein E n=1 Tax=Alicyclobacillus tolerans TaxID=90970 RepID=A0A1M6PEV1_9BACL|nr:MULTISPECIES: stage II sporulation protein E [Alicyclobacillus]SHK06479.1 stage II sporulation protein E [Alicyclobacillus montanus]
MSHLSLVGKADRPSSQKAALVRVHWQRAVLLAGMAFVLGHATILHAVSPFGFAFFVILHERGGRGRRFPAYAAVLGALAGGGVYAAAGMLLQFFMYRAVRLYILRKPFADFRFIPLIAGVVALCSKLLLIGTVWTQMDVLLALANAALVTLLCLIFIQCISIFIGKEAVKSLRHEQVAALIILAGSVVMGLSDWKIHDVSIASIAVNWMILMIACGGMGMAAAGAIVLSLLSLLSHQGNMADVAISGFGGFLSGLLKDANRFWIGLAFVLSTTVLAMSTSSDWHGLANHALAASIATVIYWLTPRRLHLEVASYVPGTLENRQSEQDRVRRMNQLMAEKIEQFGQIFEELAVTFADHGENPYTTAQQLVTHMVSTTAGQVCSGCARRATCWDKQGIQTYQAMANTISQIESCPPGKAFPTHDLKERCCRLDAMMGVLKYNLDLTYRDEKWMAKLHDLRTLVAAQLGGVAAVVRAITDEIEESERSALSDEEQILAALEKLGLYVDRVHIVSLDAGKIHIEVLQPTDRAYETSTKVIAPLLSGVVGETLSLSKLDANGDGYSICVFASARRYSVHTAVASAARGGRIVSGDTHTAVDLGNGRFAIAVSDGMGNGERARRESRAAIELLKKLLKAGFDEQLAIRTVNSTLLLRSQDEMFATLDMALIDLYSAKTEFLKVGSAPSYILRGNDIMTITGAGVPIGILQDIDVQAVTEDLQDGDILILISDGIYDAPKETFEPSDWLQQQLRMLKTRDAQSIADTLVEAAVRANNGKIADDMTVVVAKVGKFEPEWATIKIPGVQGLRRKADKRRRGA